MTLQDTIRRLLDLSLHMTEALAKDDIPGALDHLVDREQAMTEFIQRDRAASPQEKSTCAPLYNQLKLADRELQDLAETVMTRTQAEMCRSLGAPAGTSDASQCRTGCLDRRA